MVEESQVRKYLKILDIHKPMGPNGMHPRVQSELADLSVRPFLIIFKQSWQLEGVDEDWKKANVTPIIKKVKEEDPEVYRPVNLTSIPRKVREQLMDSSRGSHA